MVGKAREWFNGDKATNEWLGSMKKSSRNTYRSQWKRFLDYMGKTGDQILAEREADKNYQWEKTVIKFSRWLKEKKGLSENTAVTAGGVVRGFFSFHRSELKFRRAESRQLRESRRKTEDYRFSREDLKKMADVADLEEKYVVVAGKSFGLRAGDFLALTRGDLEPYIDREVPISIGAIGTRKESVKAYPFIDSDAQPVIKMMLNNMTRQGRTEPSDRMLTHKHTIQLSRVLKRLADRAGIEHGNKIVRFHNLRKFLIDRLASIMSESKWKQIVGKTITEGAYVSTESLREDYKRAMEETCFTKSVSEQDMEFLATQKAMEMALKMMPAPENVKKEILKKLRRSKTLKDLEIAEKDIEKLKRSQEQQRNSNNCADGQNCQRIVTEQELSSLLAKGWRVAAVLPSGKVVISND